MRTIIVWCMVFAICLGAGGGSVKGQDFGQLLEAVDKLETSLKKLLKKEAAERSAEIGKLRAELKKLGPANSSKSNTAEWAALNARVDRMSNIIGENSDSATGDVSDIPGLIEEIDLLRSEIQSLKSLLDKNSTQLASLESTIATKNSSSTKSVAGPKYNNLRYKDDYSYLNSSANRGNDLFDPLKGISLGSNSDLSFGGSYRFRFESDNNRKLGASTPVSQEVYLNRMFLHADLQIVHRVRFFTEFKYAGIRNNELPAGALAHDRPDIENLFVDGWMISNNAFKFGARLGRQELQFGKQRLISPLDWANTRRTFDGFRLMSHFNGWSIDAFVTRPVKAEPKELNSSDRALAFSGLYSTKKLHGNTLSGYFLVFTKDVPIDLATGLSGDFEYLTLGAAYDGKGGRFDWSSEAAYQFGSLGDKNIAAYMLTLSGGYSYKSHAFKPRIGFSWDIASGDSDPTDDKVSTFHQQFPLGHAYFGWADQVGRRNINSLSVQLSAHPSKIVTTKLNWFSFNLMQKEDALYNAGGKVSRQDATGASGRHVGNELDALVIFKLNRHASFHVGYTHFKPGAFIANTGTAESHNMLYMMLPVKF